MKLGAIACVLVSIALAVLACEVFVRLYLHIPDKSFSEIVTISENAKDIRPNLSIRVQGAYREFDYRIKTNQLGCRVTHPFINSIESTILMLGDSQLFGIGVDDHETIASQLSMLLNVPVASKTCPGLSNVEEFILLKRYAPKIKPKICVLGFFAGNDPYENYKKRPGENLTQSTAALKEPGPLAQFKQYIIKHSGVYILLTKLRANPLIGRFLKSARLLNASPPFELTVFEKKESSLKQDFWDATVKSLDEINQFANQSGIKLVILFIPDKYQVVPSYWNLWRQKYSLENSSYDLRAPNRILRQFCEDRKIPFLDVTDPLFAVLQNSAEPYWKIDNHLNQQGNIVIANALHHYLLEKGLISHLQMAE